jgi:putative nucleotidyltransferase with HDIG domain
MARESILIVDDDPHFRSTVSGMLEKANYLPATVSSAKNALEQLQKGASFDLILSDIVVDGADGMGWLQRARQIQPDTPIVVVSAVHEIDAIITAMRLGASDYLTKPFKSEQLLSVVERALEYRRTVRQNAVYKYNLEQLVTARTEMLRDAMADLERSYDITLEALGDALDLKDAETEGHSKRVTAYTVALARAMNIPPEQMRTIARGAYLHDIGKMAIPDAILLKPVKLDVQEQVLMREHCARGYRILKKIPFLSDAAEIVYSHQEHFDGSGYPRGLKGDEIPLGARIFSIADTLDAITSDRPYRTASSFAEARREIERCSGTQFDPQVAKVYLGMPDQLWDDLHREISRPSRRPPISLPNSEKKK